MDHSPAPLHHLRWNDISAEDLLQRPLSPVYGPEAIRLVRGRRILVTGAGGSIGSEIVRQLHQLGAQELFYVDADEYALYVLQRGLEGSALLDDHHYHLASVRHREKIRNIFAEVQPEIVYHAAAHKHLPLLERSPEAAVLTNVLGTQIVAEACAEFRVQRFINISTDKAARPTSILGLTKRVAELVVSGQSELLRAASVRFGNVLGSRGSFLETLAYQMGHHLPIRLVHADVSRWFMTIPEAAGLVIEASVLASAGETYILDMGAPIRILDLIRRFAHLCGMAMPEIVITGLRTGEKLHEDLVDPTEIRSATSHSKISRVTVGTTHFMTDDDLDALYELAYQGSPAYDIYTALESSMRTVPALALEALS